jgi:hypothetical protein
LDIFLTNDESPLSIQVFSACGLIAREIVVNQIADPGPSLSHVLPNEVPVGIKAFWSLSAEFHLVNLLL